MKNRRVINVFLTIGFIISIVIFMFLAAEAEAKANNTLSQSITPELIQLKEAEARLQHGWVTVQGGTTTTATIAGQN